MKEEKYDRTSRLEIKYREGYIMSYDSSYNLKCKILWDVDKLLVFKGDYFHIFDLNDIIEMNIWGKRKTIYSRD